MAQTQKLQDSLIEWIKTFPGTTRITTHADFANGSALRRILREIDSDYFFTRLLEPAPHDASSNLSNIDQNIESISDIHRAVLGYIKSSRKSRVTPRQQLTTHELSQIAEGVRGVGLSKLLQLVVIVAINGPRKQESLRAMAGVRDEGVKRALMDTIKSFSVDQALKDAPAESSEQDPGGNETVVADKAKKDDFAYEAALSRQAAAQKALEQRVASLTAQLESRNEELAELRTSTASAPSSPTKRAKGGNEISQLKEIQRVWNKQESVISDLEHRLDEAREENGSLNRVIEGLQQGKVEQQKLKDDLDAMRIERDGLAKKANTLDKYRGKLEAHRRLEAEVVELRRELETARQEGDDGDSVRVEGLVLQIEQLRTMISRIEKDFSAESSIRRKLQTQNHDLQAEVAVLQEQHRDLLADMEDRQQRQRLEGLDSRMEDSMVDTRLSINSTAFSTTDSPDEQPGSAEQARQVKLLEDEISALKLLHSSTETTSAAKLEQLSTDHTSLQSTSDSLLEAKLLAETQRDALLAKSTDAESETVKLVRKISELQAAREKLDGRIREILERAGSQEQMMVQLEAEVAASKEDEAAERARIVREAVAKVRDKAGNEIGTLRSNLRNREKAAVRVSKRLAGLIAEKAEAGKALLSAGDLRDQAVAESRTLRSAISAIAAREEEEEAPREGVEPRLTAELFSLLSSLSAARAETAAHLETLRERDREVALLESQLTLLEAGANAPTDAADGETGKVKKGEDAKSAAAVIRRTKERAREQIGALKGEVAALKREGRLMGAAWHNLQLRLADPEVMAAVGGGRQGQSLGMLGRLRESV